MRDLQSDMAITSFRDLLVWQKAMTLVENVYVLTDQFPRSEQYGLISQLRRAAISIPSNVAEVTRAKPDTSLITSTWRSDRKPNFKRSSNSRIG